ncbi:MAG: hypothetical protein ACE5HT_10950 [Gemmatimonadales bacterium]
MFRNMKRARIEAHDFSQFLAWAVGSVVSKFLPGAWGGAIPPVTQPGRHATIDEYMAQSQWRSLEPGSTLLDIGCGFPPVTTADTARRFPEVDVVGADPSFGR